MSQSILTGVSAARASATGPADEAVESITTQLRDGLAGRRASAVLYFASSSYNPRDLAGPLAERFPGTALIGCSTAGEFTDQASMTGGITAVALPEGIVGRAVAVAADLSDGAATGIDSAVARLEQQWGSPLRGLDAATHVGFVLIDGLHGDEEMVNERLGNAAPMLDFVGGSAGDDLAFAQTWIAVGDQISFHGTALLLCQAQVPFRVIKSCSLVSTGQTLKITKSDSATRTILEFDGRPAAEAYAAAIGVPVGALDSSAFLAHPVGLMIDGEPWVRSPQRLADGGGLAFYSQVVEGSDVELMRSTDLVADTAQAVSAVQGELGGGSGAVLFNCILRRLELDATGQHDTFRSALGGIPVAGFHTYGESWLGHVNQTLTGVIFG
jgi:hypothetical protein